MSTGFPASSIRGRPDGRPHATRNRASVASHGAAEVRSGDAVFRCGDDLRIVEWNAGAEELTGTAAAEAEGQFCWDVIGGRDDTGAMICHAHCSVARLAGQGWPVTCQNLHVRTPAGPKRIAISTIVLRSHDAPLILHPMREAPENEAPRPSSAQPSPQLTPRQLEILAFLADGVRVREIAKSLILSETTVRNHIRAILLELGAHSQLEAVARARACALVA